MNDFFSISVGNNRGFAIEYRLMLLLRARLFLLFGTGLVMIFATLLFLGASSSIIGAVLLCTGIIMLLSLALLRPAEKLIAASIRFNEGIDEVPEIVSIGRMSPFAPVAETINLFGDLVHKQSYTFWSERLEKEAVLASLSEGVVICDSEGRITQLNKIASKLFGVVSEDVIERRLIDLGEKGDVVYKCAELLIATLENRMAVTDSLKSEDGKLFDVTLTPRAKRDGAILVIRDGSLDHKVEQMGRDFVANASHELRTPITIIKGFAETLQDLPEISEAMLEDITDKIIRNCERMSSLVKSLITLADLDSISKSDLQKNNIVPLLEKCKEQLVIAHPEVIVEIEAVAEEVSVACDPNLLELAFMNLLENGVKYSDTIPKLTITIEEGRVTISDCGRGIPEEDIPHVFDRFYTVDKAHSRKLGGAGLGLSIVSRIVAIHGAKISVTSSHGAKFLIEFD